MNALYLSLEFETALAEYRQQDALLPPGLMVSYVIEVNPVIDLRGGVSKAWGALWQDFYCDWRKLHFNDGIEPPSWVLGDQACAADAKGIFFRSILTSGTDRVLFTDALTVTDRIAVHDPNHPLSKNQGAWQ